MGNKRKQSRTRYHKFGVAGGTYGLKCKKKQMLQKKKLQQTLRKMKDRKDPLVMSIKKKKDLKFTFARMSVQRAKRYIIKKDNGTIKLKLQATDPSEMSGNRIMNMSFLRHHVSKITMHSAVCENARNLALKGIEPIVLLGEKRNGFHTIITAKCKGCNMNFTLKNSDSIAMDKGNISEINLKSVWGSMVTGGGCSSMNEFMGTLGIPGLNPSKYTAIEEQVGEWWREALQEDMVEAGREERENAIKNESFHEGVPAITVVCDGGWCKRSHKHTYNAMAGVGVIFGLHTKKLLHIGIRNKLCYICSAAENKNQTPKEHKCFKNWSESSQAMESDIILDGFLKCEEVHGVRYMKLVADGDSSVYSNIVEHVPGWGPYVQKVECANHACKCLRAHLEQLVHDKPHHKGKGKLNALNRKRIVQGVRCAIKMRSRETNKTLAKNKLKADIRNCARHVLGLHEKCSTDFCKHSVVVDDIFEENDKDDTIDEEYGDAVKDASEMWEDTVKEMSDGEVNVIRNGGKAKVQVEEDLLKDLYYLLNRMAEKSDRLIYNFTSNLAESWMNVRCKFDGGKMTNRCFRGSFYARCYGGGLRSSRGPAWSPMIYGKCIGKRADDIFLETYRQRAQSYIRTAKIQSKVETKKNRTKRKMLLNKGNVGKGAKRSYGPKVLLDTADLIQSDLDKECSEYYKENIIVTESGSNIIEIETRGQSNNEKWKSERRKRLTSSIFGDVMSRSENNNSPSLIKRLLYTNFGGNSYTRKGIMEEENTRKEYINLKNKHQKLVSHITVPGLKVSAEQPFLATSSDGIVYLTDGTEGLIEMKNLLQNRNYDIKHATLFDKNFCLCCQSGKLSLKKNHKYYFQIQGQMNILKKEWCDFVVRRTNPYDIFIERIYKDELLWKTRMVPKLKQFYFTHILPELSVPRHGTLSGIRKPSLPWYKKQLSDTKDHSSVPKLHKRTKEQTTLPVYPNATQSVTSPPVPQLSKLKGNISTSATCLEETVSTFNSKKVESTLKRTSRKRKVKFVGRKIRHKWESAGQEQWYTGVVLGTASGVDGEPSAVYQIQYDDDEEKYDVEDLINDFNEGNLQFDDL